MRPLRNQWFGWLVAMGAVLPGTPVRQGALFVLDLSGTPLDEFPNGVKALNGVMTVVEKDGQHMLMASSPSELLITLPQVLPPVFTVEADLVPKTCCNPDDITLEGTPARNRGVASAELTWHPARISAVGGGGEMYQSDMPADLAASTPGNLTHLVFEFSGTRIKLYTNGRRMYTLEKQFVRGRVLRVGLGGESATNPMYLAGLRIGSGPATPEVIAANAGEQPGGPTPNPSKGDTSAVPPVSDSSTSRQQVETNRQGMTGSPTPTFVANVTVTQEAAGPVVSWLKVAAPATYSVKRWKVLDENCCTNSSPTLTGPPWQDVQPPLAGTYLYEVTVTTNGGTASGRAEFVNYTQGGRIASPEPAPSPAPAPVTAVLATQTGTITPIVPPPPPPPTLPAERITTRAPSLVVLDNGPAPTGLTVNGTPGTAAISWQPVAGAAGYQVDRTPLGSPNWATVTASRISDTKLSDLVPDPLATYTYRVTAYQADGHYGSGSVDFKPPAPTDPTELVATLVPPAGVRLTWRAVNGAKEYVISGPGFASDARTSTTSISVMTAPPGLNAYRVASVFPPGQVLTAVTAWPSAVVKVPPVPSVAFLTLRNGTGSLAEYNLHACNAGKWLSTQQVWVNAWCDLPTTTSIAQVTALPLLNLFGIQEFRPMEGGNLITGERFDIFVDANEWTSFQQWRWGKNNQIVPQAGFWDMADLGRGRRVGCVERGSAASAATLCWAKSDPGDLSVIVQSQEGTSFLLFRDVAEDPTKSSYCPQPTHPSDQSWMDWFCGKLLGIPSSTLDSQGERFAPHACLSCHGGVYDGATGKVTGATLLPLDPKGFNFGGDRASQEETIRQINLAVFNSRAAPGVLAYISQMYGARQAVLGATVSDDFVPPGWAAQPAVFRDIYRPYCASCHNAQNGTLGFRAWNDMVLEKARVRAAVCTGRMPHSEVAFKRFWSDGGAVSLPGWLLGALGYTGCPL